MRSVDPAEIVRVSEEFGTIAQIDRATIDLALEAIQMRPDLADIRFAMFNVSTQTISDPSFPDWLSETTTKHAVPCSTLCFQCAESDVVAALDKLEPILARLRSHGCRFSISHFGTGFSSLGYLRRLPIGFLNIDASFVKEIETEPADRELVRAINSLARTLGLLTIADGADTAGAVGALRALSVDFVTGSAASS